MNPVIHFEMPATDRNRMAGFYHHVFGWKINILSEELEHYVSVITTDSDETGNSKVPGTINGGFFLRSQDALFQSPTVVISVQDIDVFVDKIKNAGGKILGEIMEVPGIGRYVSFLDIEGNRMGILETKS